MMLPERATVQHYGSVSVAELQWYRGRLRFVTSLKAAFLKIASL